MALGWPLVATAEDSAESTQAIPPSAQEVSPTEAAAPARMFDSVAEETASLADQRGAADTASLSEITAIGKVKDNVAENLTTGSNFITEGSFAGSNGFSTVLQNSGNNVLIQNATIVNVQVQ